MRRVELELELIKFAAGRRAPAPCRAIPHAGATRASRAEPDGRSSAVQDTPIRPTRKPTFRTTIQIDAPICQSQKERFELFSCFFSFLSCLAATRPPARGRDPAQDTSRALPAARQTDTSHNSIQQSEQRLCFGIAILPNPIMPSLILPNLIGSPPGRTSVSEVAGRTLRKASKRCTRCTRRYHGTGWFSP